MSSLVFENLGLRDYKEVWDYQESLFNKVLNEKNSNVENLQHYLIFCQHQHVYTLGKSGDEQNLLLNYIQLQAKHAQFYKINRGGDITYHGPGQLVGYPILSLNHLKIGLKEYIYNLEDVIIQTIGDFGIKGERLDGATGVWMDVESGRNTRKICAIGVRSSHWVTMHGFALNVNTELEYFGHINPCGFTDKAVTSMQKELGYKVEWEQLEQIALQKFKQIFKFD